MTDAARIIAIGAWMQGSAAGLYTAGAVILYFFLRVIGAEDPAFGAAIERVFPWWGYPAIAIALIATASAWMLARRRSLGRTLAVAQWTVSIVHAFGLSIAYGLAGWILLTNIAMAAAIVVWLLYRPEVTATLDQ